MTNYSISAQQIGDETATGLTPAKIAILVAFATFAWFCAANYIRVRGPLGEFSGLKGIMTFAATIPFTLPLNWLTRKAAGLPAHRMVTAIAVTAATATMLDGVAMTQFPALYGTDPLVMGAGAVWLLWAIGVGLALALITSSLSKAPQRN